MAVDLVKSSDVLFSAQLNQMAKNIDDFKVVLGLSDAEVAAMKTDAKIFGFTVASQLSIPDFGKMWTSFKDNLRKGKDGLTLPFPIYNPVETPAPPLVINGIENRFRERARLIKANKNYNDAMGQALGIVAEQQNSPNATDVKPVILELKLSGSKVLLKWRKAGFDGINVYRKKGEGNFEFVGVDMSPDWMDNSPLPPAPEKWTYKIVYIKKDEEVSQFSDEVSISVVAQV